MMSTNVQNFGAKTFIPTWTTYTKIQPSIASYLPLKITPKNYGLAMNVKVHKHVHSKSIRSISFQLALITL